MLCFPYKKEKHDKHNIFITFFIPKKYAFSKLKKTANLLKNFPQMSSNQNIEVVDLKLLFLKFFVVEK